jgi:hypothetical protein
LCAGHGRLDRAFGRIEKTDALNIAVTACQKLSYYRSLTTTEQAEGEFEGQILVRATGCKIWIADAHRDGKRYVVHADEKLTAFLELERATCESLRFPKA